MRILQVHARYRWRGGEETTVENDAQVLREGGHDVFQYVVDNPVTTARSIKSLAIAPYNLHSRHRVRDLARERQVDIIHVHNTWFEISPSVLGSGADIDVPVVATIQNYRLACAQGNMLRDGSLCTLCLGRSPFPGIKYRCYRGSRVLSAWNSLTARGSLRLGMWDQLAVVIVPSRFTADVLIEGGLRKDQIVVRPNTAPDPGFRRVPARDSDTVLYVGRLSVEKGVSLLLEGWARARPNLRLLIVGDGPSRSSLERAAPPGVQFVGWQPREEVQSLMLESRALAFPSIWFESCPLVVIEAFAAGLPVVGHRVGAVTEMLEPLGSAAIVDDASAASWGLALDQVQSGEVVEDLSGAARSVYETKHHPSVGLATLVAIYSKALGSRGG